MTILASQDLPFGSATLSGGARVASAGGGQPLRLTIAEDAYWNVSSTAGMGGVVFDPDGLHFWTCTLTSVIKVNIATGVTAVTITSNASDGGARTFAAPQNITRRGPMLYFTNNAIAPNNFIGEINTATLVCRLYGGGIASPVFGIMAEPGKFWVRPTNTGNGLATEFTLAGTGDAATATATGRTIAGVYGMCGDGGADVYMYYSNGTAANRYKLSDGSLTTLSPPNTNLPNMPGYGSQFRGLIWDKSLAQPVAWQVGDVWTRVALDCSAWQGRVYGYGEFGTVMSQNSNLCPALADWSDDLSQMAYTTVVASAVASITSAVKVKAYGPQRARWTWTPTESVTLEKIVVPGDLGNSSGAIANVPNSPAFIQNVYDHRRTKIFYQVNAGARVEYRGQDLNVGLINTDTLTVDIEFQNKSTILAGPPPWVAGLAGEPPSLEYTKADNAVVTLGSILSVDLDLEDASLSGGVVRLASSGTYPERLTPTADLVVDLGATDASSIMFGSDNASIIVANNATVRKFLFDGTLVWSTTAGNAWALFRIDSNTIGCGRQLASATYFELDETSGALVTRTLPLSIQRSITYLNGKLWCSNGGAALCTEVDRVTLLATGRTLTAGSTINQLWSNAAEASPGLYLHRTTGTIEKWEDLAGTMTLTKTWTPTGTAPAPGANQGVNMITDSQGRPFVKNLSVAIDRFNAAGGNQGGVAERLVWGGPEISGPSADTSGGGNQNQTGMALSPDENWFAFLTNRIDQGLNDGVAIVKKLATSRAEWTVPVTGPSPVLLGIDVAGNFGNQHGITIGWRPGTTQDFRRSKLFYQRVGLDGARVYPQEGFSFPLAGLSLVGASSLKVGVDFDVGFGKPGGPLPYLGGASGGPRVWIDDGTPPATGGGGPAISGAMRSKIGAIGVMKSNLGARASLKARMDTP